MTYQQETSTVVTAPLALVEKRLGEVESWPRFLVGVQRVSRLTDENYLFHLVEGDQARDVPVAVVVDPATHRITWRALTGPQFGGTLQLTPTDGGWTQVRLALTNWPEGFWANLTEYLTEVLSPPGSREMIDLARLQDYVTEPADPSGAGQDVGPAATGSR